MAKERKRIKPTRIKQNGPRKRPPKESLRIKSVIKDEEKDSTKIKVHKKIDERYIRVCENESIERFKEMGELVNKKEVKWVRYAVENSKGYHFYRKL